MTLRTAAPVGSRRPGRLHVDERGAVTVEAALAIIGMTVVLAAVIWVLGLLAAQLAVGEAARAAARVAARGDTAPEVAAEATSLVPDAQVRLADEDGHVVVEVRRTVRPPGLLARWGSVELRARAVAVAEQP